MKKIAIQIISLLFIISCSDNKQVNNPANSAISEIKDSIPPPKLTIIADLPDSLKPKIFILTEQPKIVQAIPPIPIPAARPLATITNFNTDHGMALSTVSSGFCDRFGNLWFGTYGGGVSRYDGKSFETFSTANGLASNIVYSITEDKSGNLWFGTNGGGVSRYDGKSFKTFSTENGLNEHTVMSIREDKSGNIWFGTENGGASRYDGKRFENFSTENGLAGKIVRSITEDKFGNIWFGTNGGASRYDGKSFENFSTANGLVGNNVLSITEDKYGNIWFGTTGGASRYDGKSFENFSLANGLASNTVLSITKDKSGKLWFGTMAGVSRYDGKSFMTFSTANGLSSNAVFSITEDKSGNLWFGTYGGGVSRYEGKSFETFSLANGLAGNNARSITEDKYGNLWFGTYGNGVCRYDGKSFENFSTANGLANNTVWSITEDKFNNLWFGTDGGVSRYDGKSFENFSTANGLANNSVWSITEDKSSNLWFGTLGGGVSRYDGKSFETFSSANGLASNFVYSITEDKFNNIWFGTDGGVSRFDGKSFETFSTANGLASKIVTSIIKDKSGNIWLGTDGGVSRYDGKSFMTFSTANGLANNMVYDLKLDEDGVLWIGTNLGYSSLVNFIKKNKSEVIKNKAIPSDNMLSNNELEHYEPVWEIYNNKTGYPIKDLNNNAMCITKIGFLDMDGKRYGKGIIWGGCGDEKVIRFDPKAIHKNLEPPVLKIKNIMIAGEIISWHGLGTKYEIQTETDSAVYPAFKTEEVSIAGKVLSNEQRKQMLERFVDVKFDSIQPFYPIPINLVLPYQHNSISFDFNAIETGRPHMLRYQYMLEGYDRDWSPISDNTSATFGNMREGDYTLKIKAQSPEGVWSEPLAYSFTILPPWWRTYWAYILYAFLFVFALGIFVKWLDKKIKKERENLRVMIAIRTEQLEQKTEELVEKNIIVEKQKEELVLQKEELIEKNLIVEKEKKKSDDLLLNILPSEVAEELKNTGSSTAKQYNHVSVLFTDFVNFSGISEQLSPTELVAAIHQNFTAFDAIMEKNGLEKIKTIGDAYMAVCGLPNEIEGHAKKAVQAAIDIRDYIKNSSNIFEIRIGVHSGPVVAGIVGVKKFAYDIWGDTVNTAARMEQNSEPGKINISGTTFELVKEHFKLEYRGKIAAKNKGEIDMYFVENELHRPKLTGVPISLNPDGKSKSA
jgi:ligand-binding sensor domain-containing protein/class 3 adenylate cyclase